MAGVIMATRKVKCEKCSNIMPTRLVAEFNKAVKDLKKTFPGTPAATWVCGDCCAKTVAAKGLHEPKAR